MRHLEIWNKGIAEIALSYGSIFQFDDLRGDSSLCLSLLLSEER
jgi:hypothetical protein